MSGPIEVGDNVEFIPPPEVDRWTPAQRRQFNHSGVVIEIEGDGPDAGLVVERTTEPSLGEVWFGDVSCVRKVAS